MTWVSKMDGSLLRNLLTLIDLTVRYLRVLWSAFHLKSVFAVLVTFRELLSGARLGSCQTSTMERAFC